MHPATFNAFIDELEKIAGMDSGFTGRAGVMTGVVGGNKPPPLRSAAGIRGAPSMGSGGMLNTQPKMSRAVSNMVPKSIPPVAPKLTASMPKPGGIMNAVKGLFSKQGSVRDSALSIFL